MRDINSLPNYPKFTFHSLDNTTTEKQQLLECLINDLKAIQHLKAIVLGGSYAEGMATETSDIDLGLYYDEKTPFNIEEIKQVIKSYEIEPSILTDFYEWGPYVNGGAWINTQYGKIDLLYRNITQVKNIIEKSQNGDWENCYEQQPPYGFLSITYLAETEICIPLYDPQEIIKELKLTIHKYPQKLKKSIIAQSLWSAEFTIWHAESFAKQKDLYNLSGCLTRAVKNLINTLFAINEKYPLGDKRSLERLNKVTLKPQNLQSKIESILCIEPADIQLNVKRIKLLFNEIKSLTDEYIPLYKL